MPSIGNWNPSGDHVQGGMREGNFVNGQFIVLCAGPPFLKNLSAAGGNVNDVGSLKVYPVGLCQNIGLSQSKNIQRIFEIGSDRSYFISGRSVGQLSLSRVMYHGPSLLRVLYAYYDTSNDPSGFQIRPLMGTSGAASPFGVAPFRKQDGAGNPGTDNKGPLHSVKVPPGYDNFFINLASDLFSQPFGLMLLAKDNNDTTIGAVYMEQCYVPNLQFGIDAQGLIVQESCGIQYEKIVPIKQTQLGLVQDIGGVGGGDGFLPDLTGGWNSKGGLA